MLQLENLIRLRWACRAAIAVTIALSVWINVLHVRPGNTIGIVISAIPPILVLGSLELVSRIPIDPNRPWFQKFPRPFAMFALAGGGGYLSYIAQKHAILTHTGEKAEAYVLPLLVDGFMVVISVSLYELSARMMAIELAKQGKDIKLAVTSKPRVKELSKKEQVAILLGNDPLLTDTEIAKRVGASYNYVNTLTKELKRLNGAELNGASVH